MTVLLAPGQGSQKQGLLTSWLKHPNPLVSEPAQTLIKQASERIDLDLTYLGTTAETAEITATAIAQPLIITASLISYRNLIDSKNQQFSLVAGHSVGELAAAAIANIISPLDAIYLASIRGKAMEKACKLADTGMSALLGGNESDVLARLDEYDLIPANYNAKGQIVAAGSKENLAKLAENPPESARVRPLAVAGAFHTPYMSSAQSEFKTAIDQIHLSDPTIDILSNRDGQRISSGQEYADRLVAQITQPVRWDLCLDYIRSHDQDATIELAPSGALLGIARRELKGLTNSALSEAIDISSNTDRKDTDNLQYT